MDNRPLVVIQFPSGVVPSAEMAGFTPCMGIFILLLGNWLSPVFHADHVVC